MSDLNSDSEQYQSPAVPTIAGERQFLAQCEYINRNLTAIARQMRQLLDQRGWRSQWCQEDNEVVWSKTFPDGVTQHLDVDDAYDYEQDYTRQFFHNTGIAMKPRKGQKPPASAA